MPGPSSHWSANPSSLMQMRAAEIPVRAAPACAWRSASKKESPHEISPLVADGPAVAVAGGARLGRASDLRAPQGARHVRAVGEAQCRTRLARHGVGALAA